MNPIQSTKTGPQDQTPHRVVIVGGGFGGLAAARSFRARNIQVTLIDQRNFHLFQPLLYQVATGELSPANIASPLRAILRRHRHVRVLLGQVVGFDLVKREIQLSDGTLEYDSLIVAVGAKHSYFGHPEWEKYAPGLKTVEDATEIRRRILEAFEQAERETDPLRQAEWLTFVIVGGGPTGVELCGALSEVAHHTLKYDFRWAKPSQAKIILVEASPRPLGMYPEELTDRAIQDLKRLKVEVLTQCQVTQIEAQKVTVKCGDQEKVIEARTMIWAAGVEASPLGKVLADQTGAKIDRSGRITVEPDCSLPGHPEVFVIGDLANFPHQDARPLPGLAPVAMQQGAYVAKRITARAQGRSSPDVFHYRDRGSMAVIGRYSAIAVIGNWKLGGLLAWILWIVIHVREITQFRNRVIVFFQWGWTFFTRDRHARLITGSGESEN